MQVTVCYKTTCWRKISGKIELRLLAQPYIMPFTWPLEFTKIPKMSLLPYILILAGYSVL